MIKKNYNCESRIKRSISTHQESQIARELAYSKDQAPHCQF